MTELGSKGIYGIDLPAELEVGECTFQARASGISDQGIQLTLVNNASSSLATAAENKSSLGVTIHSDSGDFKKRVKIQKISQNVIGLAFEDRPEKGSPDFEFLAKISSSPEQFLDDSSSEQKVSDPEHSFHGIYLLQRALWRYGRMFAFLLVNLLAPLLKKALKPKVVFAVYGTKGDQRAYFPDWFRALSPSSVLVGLFKSKLGWGMMVTTPIPENELAEDSEAVRNYIYGIQNTYKATDTFSLVGRLPGFALRAGLKLEQPLVNGCLGTRFAMVESAKQLADKFGRPTNQLTIAILGGAGRIGEPLIQDLSKLFLKVIAIDPRYEQEVGTIEYGAQVLKSQRPERLSEADLVLVLTARGNDIEDMVEWFKPGAYVADDTHPCIKRPIRNRLAIQGVHLFKTVVGATEFAMYPRMPNFHSGNIPGCLLEGLVISEHGWQVANDPEVFFETASASGYYAQLIKPRNDS